MGQMLKLKIPTPVYALVTAALMWLLNVWLPLVILFKEPWNALGLLIALAGIAIDLLAVIQFRKEGTTINPLRPDDSVKVLENGLYRISRNPMYLGMLLILTGLGVWLGSVTPLLCLPLFVLVITTQQILPEEETLRYKFGQDYLDYMHRVRRWL